MSDLPLLQTPNGSVTQLALSILRQAGPDAYGKLVVDGPSPATAHAALDGVLPEQLIAGPIQQIDGARGALAGLWLWQGALSQSHEISQSLLSPTGSFWHAIMHRLEGDFSNAKYWYRRCESHHVIKMMGAIVSSLAGDLASDRAVAHALRDGWNPLGFVDLVEAVHKKPSDPRYDLAVRLQRAEWIGLFNYCVREAVDAGHDGLDQWDARVTDPAGG